MTRERQLAHSQLWPRSSLNLAADILLPYIGSEAVSESHFYGFIFSFPLLLLINEKYDFRLVERYVFFLYPVTIENVKKRGYTNTLKPTQSIFIFLIRINSIVDCAMSACPSDCTSKSLLLQELEISQINFLYVIHIYNGIDIHRHRSQGILLLGTHLILVLKSLFPYF